MTNKEKIRELISKYNDINLLLNDMKAGETRKNVSIMESLIEQNEKIISIFSKNL